jgi:hypothetical protein
MGDGLYRDLWDVKGALLTLEEVQTAWSAGTIGQATRVRKLGERSWTTVAEIPGISWPSDKHSSSDRMMATSGELEIEHASSDRMMATSGELEIVDLPNLSPTAPICIPPLPATPPTLVPATAFVDLGRTNALFSYPPTVFVEMGRAKAPSSYPPTSLPLSAPRTTGRRMLAPTVLAAGVLALFGGAAVAVAAVRHSRWTRVTMPPPASSLEASRTPTPSKSPAPPAAEALTSAESATPQDASLDPPTPSSAPLASAPRPHAAAPPRGPAHPRHTSPKTR